MENLRLDTGKFLSRDYGKYGSGLVFISDKELDSFPDDVKNIPSFWYIKIDEDNILKAHSRAELEQKVIEYIVKKLELNDLSEGRKYGIACDYNDNYRKYLTVLEKDGDYWESTGLDITDIKDHFISDYIYQEQSYEFDGKNYNSITEIIKEYNIPFDGSVVSIVKGKFRKNKKGTAIFDLTMRGDILIKISWGGSFNKSRGVEIDKIKDYVYYKHARSNGGGTGYDYLILKENSNNLLSEDDI